MRLDKFAFFEELGYRPHAGQREIHASSARVRVVACGVRWGKTLAAAMEALAAAMEPRANARGWIVAPTYDLAEKVFREIVRVAVGRLQHRKVDLKEHEKKIVLRNLGGGLSEIRIKSADNPVSLLGEGLDFVIADEASRLKPSIWPSYLSQRLLDRKGWALLISTPRGKGWFYELFRLGRGLDPACASWNHPSWTNPTLDAAEIERQRAVLPEAVFRQEYGGEFLEGAGAVFRNVRECATGTWKEPVPGEHYYGGLDLAKVEDFTVLVIVNRKREVVFVDRFHRIDWGVQTERVRAALKRYNRATALVDVTGVGDPIYETLRANGCRVKPYSLTHSSKDAIIRNLGLLLEQRQVVLPKPELWPEGVDELEAYEYSVTEAGTMRMGAPAACHDDCVTALALALWEVRPNRPKPAIYFVDLPGFFG